MEKDDLPQSDGRIRLAKFFTDAGIISRRAAEAEIIAGNITVNGTVAVIGQKINPAEDTVVYNGKTVHYNGNNEHMYIMLNKPRGFVTTMDDEKGRNTTAASLLSGVNRRVYPVGRLDMYSDGLLLFTDDGILTNALTHPSHEIPKYYRVRIRGSVSTEMLEKLRSALTLDGYTIRPVDVTSEGLNPRDGTTVLNFPLYEGRNRQIRKMCDIAGIHAIVSLTRYAVGDLKLGTLPVGKWRNLTDGEIAYLKNATGVKSGE